MLLEKHSCSSSTTCRKVLLSRFSLLWLSDYSLVWITINFWIHHVRKHYYARTRCYAPRARYVASLNSRRCEDPAFPIRRRVKDRGGRSQLFAPRDTTRDNSCSLDPVGICPPDPSELGDRSAGSRANKSRVRAARTGVGADPAPTQVDGVGGDPVHLE